MFVVAFVGASARACERVYEAAQWRFGCRVTSNVAQDVHRRLATQGLRPTDPNPNPNPICDPNPKGLRPTRDVMPILWLQVAAGVIHCYEQLAATPAAASNYIIILLMISFGSSVALFHSEADQRRRWLWSKITSGST